MTPADDAGSAWAAILAGALAGLGVNPATSDEAALAAGLRRLHAERVLVLPGEPGPVTVGRWRRPPAGSALAPIARVWAATGWARGCHLHVRPVDYDSEGAVRRLSAAWQRTQQPATLTVYAIALAPDVHLPDVDKWRDAGDADRIVERRGRGPSGDRGPTRGPGPAPMVPPRPAPRPAPPSRMPVDLPETSERPSRAPASDTGAAPAPTPGKAPRRRLRARVRDSVGMLRTDGFTRGESHTLTFRVSARAAAGDISARKTLLSPTPGVSADLTVWVRRRGAKTAPVTRPLTLPATGDSAWTDPIDCPSVRKGSELAYDVVVLHRGRALQTAVLSGPLLEPGVIGTAKGITLRVDDTTPAEGLQQRSAADATLILTLGPDERPVLVDLAAVATPTAAARADKVNEDIRSALLNVFAAPPTDLAGAAPTLTRLAVLGSTLLTQLAGSELNFHDDDRWIHVVDLQAGDVPLELLYTHPMPSDDNEVPVCGPALAGAHACAGDCPDRQRDDRVCPFGFWGTSKILERRLHTPGRDAPATNQGIQITQRAVVGLSEIADRADPTTSERIVRALTDLVGAAALTRADDWKGVREGTSGEPATTLLVLVTHTIHGADPLLGVSIEVGGKALAAHRVTDRFVNGSGAQPGPVVLSLGCDTDRLDVGFADWVRVLERAQASVVMSTIAPVPASRVGSVIERVCQTLASQLAGPGPHRWGAVLTAVRQQTVAEGDLLALALTATGDGDLELLGGR